MTSVFISGSRGISRLTDSVRERLDNILGKGYTVLVGDANGADKAVQSYLDTCGYRNVVVYCSGMQCRNNVGNWKTKMIEIPDGITGRDFYERKDAAMASDSDYGFVLWDGKSAGALNNVVELLEKNKKIVVYFRPERRFAMISSIYDIETLLKHCDPNALEKVSSKIGLGKKLRQVAGSSQKSFEF